MKVNWNNIKLILVLGVLVFLFSFTKQRNEARNLTKIQVEFVDENEPFITLPSVNKLLIQNQDSVTGILKERLVLKEAENRLLANDMIQDAQVFITVDGILGAKIKQRNPVARVIAATDYYIDDEGKKMPLSKVFTARVPIVTGISQEDVDALTPVLVSIKNDVYLQQTIVGIQKNKKGEFVFNIRKHDCKIIIGSLRGMDKKFQNLKAFLKKASKDNALNLYKTIDLKFGNQVVATKK